MKQRSCSPFTPRARVEIFLTPCLDDCAAGCAHHALAGSNSGRTAFEITEPCTVVCYLLNSLGSYSDNASSGMPSHFAAATRSVNKATWSGE